MSRSNRRSIEALRNVAYGLTIDETAEAMHLSRSSVEKYLRKARESLNARTLAHAVYLATRAGFICVLMVAVSFGSPDHLRRAPRTVRTVRREVIATTGSTV